MPGGQAYAGCNTLSAANRLTKFGKRTIMNIIVIIKYNALHKTDILSYKKSMLNV